MSPLAASSRTWPVTSKRWFSPGVSKPRTVETSAPVFGSTAPYTTCRTRAGRDFDASLVVVAIRWLIAVGNA
jgi:hypothetical protein